MDIQNVTLGISTTPLFDCAICNKRSKCAFRNHLMNHTDKKSVYVCKKKIGINSRLCRHEQIHTVSKETHVLEICSETYMYESPCAMGDLKKRLLMYQIC